MDSKYVSQVKSDYAELLIANGSTQRALEISQKDTYEPIFEIRETHPEAEPIIKEYNECVKEVCLDLTGLIVGFRDAAFNFKNLMTTTDARLAAIKKTLLIEKEKQEDMNILCNNYTEFNSVIPLSTDNMSGSFSYADGVISAKINSQESIGYTISSIEGNGYEGNKYVYKDKKFLKETIDTSNRSFITDGNNITVYEYSRITANNSEKEVIQYVNLDSIEAKMTLELKGSSEFNKISILTASIDTVITNVLTSQDGITYTSVLPKPLKLNDASGKFSNTNYIANSGLLCFPSSKYLKVVLESNGTTDDVLAFEKLVVTPLVNQIVLPPAVAEPQVTIYPERPAVTANLYSKDQTGAVYDKSVNIATASYLYNKTTNKIEYTVTQ